MPSLYFYSYIYDKILPLHGLTQSDGETAVYTKQGQYFKLHINQEGQPPQFELLLNGEFSFRTVAEKEREILSSK